MCHVFLLKTKNQNILGQLIYKKFNSCFIKSWPNFHCRLRRGFVYNKLFLLRRAAVIFCYDIPSQSFLHSHSLRVADFTKQIIGLHHVVNDVKFLLVERCGKDSVDSLYRYIIMYHTFNEESKMVTTSFLNQLICFCSGELVHNHNNSTNTTKNVLSLYNHLFSNNPDAFKKCAIINMYYV